MPTVAKYDVVSDTPIELSADGVSIHDFPLETPGIDVTIRTLVSFMFKPLLDAVVFRKFIVNGKGTTSIGTLNEGGLGGGRVCQEVIDPNVLQPTGNTLRIEVTLGNGIFSDVMFWYQINV